MQAPSDPELMELLSQLPELESLDAKSALDQMRHFCGSMSGNDHGAEAKSARANRIKSHPGRQHSAATDAALLRYLLMQNRKPN